MNLIRIDVTPGAGGQDAIDWSATLLNMYKVFAKTFGPVIVHAIDNVECAITFDCPNAYLPNILNECGVHRLIQNSPNDPQHRRQTAFAEVIVNDNHRSGDFSQLRTYTLDPYKQCKNEYNGVTESDVEAVLAGKIQKMWRPVKLTDPPSAATLQWLKTQCSMEKSRGFA